MRLCCTRLVRQCRLPADDRYWVSATWVEAEHPGRDVHPDWKGYFHRYKIRFDWVDGQSAPWWEQPDSSVRTPFPGRAPLDSAASTLASQGHDHSVAQKTCDEGDRTLAAPLGKSNLNVVIDRPGNYEIKSGLLTPPTTPPERNAKFELSALLQADTDAPTGENLQLRIWEETDVATHSCLPRKLPEHDDRHLPGSAMLWDHIEAISVAEERIL